MIPNVLWCKLSTYGFQHKCLVFISSHTTQIYTNILSDKYSCTKPRYFHFMEHSILLLYFQFGSNCCRLSLQVLVVIAINKSMRVFYVVTKVVGHTITSLLSFALLSFWKQTKKIHWIRLWYDTKSGKRLDAHSWSNHRFARQNFTVLYYNFLSGKNHFIDVYFF